jgi:hypothetical protein
VKKGAWHATCTKSIFYYFSGTALEIARSRPYYWHSPRMSANSQPDPDWRFFPGGRAARLVDSTK